MELARLPINQRIVLYIGMGCFWGVEKSINRKFPNIDTKTGYAVSDILAGEVEVVKLNLEGGYLDRIMDFFWTHHSLSPPEYWVPVRYRSVLFYEDGLEEVLLRSRKQVSRLIGYNPYTLIGQIDTFKIACERHQKRYLEDSGICSLQTMRKL